MNTKQNILFNNRWLPVRQWMVAGSILAAAWLGVMVKIPASWSYYATYVSLLLLACMNPVVNAVHDRMLRNTIFSLLLFAAHSGLCFLMFRYLESSGMTLRPQLFAAILVFYAVSILLSGLFRGIYLLVSKPI